LIPSFLHRAQFIRNSYVDFRHCSSPRAFPIRWHCRVLDKKKGRPGRDRHQHGVQCCIPRKPSRVKSCTPTRGGATAARAGSGGNRVQAILWSGTSWQLSSHRVWQSNTIEHYRSCCGPISKRRRHSGSSQQSCSTTGSVTLVFWGDQSFNGTGAVCSFDSSGAGASSAGCLGWLNGCRCKLCRCVAWLNGFGRKFRRPRTR